MIHVKKDFTFDEKEAEKGEGQGHDESYGRESAQAQQRHNQHGREGTLFGKGTHLFQPRLGTDPLT